MDAPRRERKGAVRALPTSAGKLEEAFSRPPQSEKRRGGGRNTFGLRAGISSGSRSAGLPLAGRELGRGPPCCRALRGNKVPFEQAPGREGAKARRSQAVAGCKPLGYSPVTCTARALLLNVAPGA